MGTEVYRRLEKSARRRLRLLGSDREVDYRACIKHQGLDALSRPKTRGTEEINLGEELPVLMIFETEKQQDIKKNYFYKDQLENERSCSHMDTNGK